MDYTVHGILQARILEWVVIPSPGDLPNPGIEPRSLTLQADSLPAEPQGKPRNTGVGSLSLLQGIFPIQGSNWGNLATEQHSIKDPLLVEIPVQMDQPGKGSDLTNFQLLGQ